MSRTLRRSSRLGVAGAMLSGVFWLFTVESVAWPRGAPEATTGAEIVRGAKEISEITHKRYTYTTIHRHIRQCLERTAQHGRATFGFIVGAHAAAALWTNQLPPDVAWRETSTARHLGIVLELLPRIDLGPEEVARTVAHVVGASPAAEKWLLYKLHAGAPVGDSTAS